MKQKSHVSAQLDAYAIRRYGKHWTDQLKAAARIGSVLEIDRITRQMAQFGLVHRPDTFRGSLVRVA